VHKKKVKAAAGQDISLSLCLVLKEAASVKISFGQLFFLKSGYL
jgi:hypothetical protein